MILEDAIEDFLSYCTFEKGLTNKTRISYQYDLKTYCQFLMDKEIKDVQMIKDTDIKEFLKARKIEESTTIAHNLTVIKNFHIYLLKEKLVDTDVSEFIERPKLKKALPKTLSVEEIDKLLDIKLLTPFDYRNKAMLELMYGCGLRVSELINLENNDIDMINCLIRITGKGNKERIIPISEYSMISLKAYIKIREQLLKKTKCNKLFLNNHGQGITRQGFFKILKKLLIKKNLNSTISPHALRHSFATHLINCGADLRSIQELLGHSDISTTKIYTRITDEKVLKDYEKFHLRSKKNKE